MRLSLIIATYNQASALDKLFSGLAQQISLPDEILIADDGSGPDTRTVIDNWRPKISSTVHHFWQPDEGFFKLRILNKTLAAATGDYVVFTDGDCVPHPSFIADHRALAEPGYWVQGRRCFVREPFVAEFIPGQTNLWSWSIRGRISRPHKSIRLPFPIVFRDQKQRGIIGCNMAFWREDLVAVNGFDEAYAGRGKGADSDLGSRVYNLGRRRKFVYGQALVYHLDHPIAPRPHLNTNKARLNEVIQSRRIRCESGLNQHLKA